MLFKPDYTDDESIDHDDDEEVSVVDGEDTRESQEDLPDDNADDAQD